jgi:hypothetical protein
MPPELSPLEIELLKRIDSGQAVTQALCKDLLTEVRAIRKALKLADQEEIAAQKAWRAQLLEGARWIGPKIWELLRTPMGALLVGILLAQLSRALDIAPADLLQFLGVAPIPEPAKNEQFLGAPTIPEPVKNEEP